MLVYILYNLVIYFNMFIIFYVLVAGILNVIQMVISIYRTPRYVKRNKYANIKQFNDSSHMIPISILVPAYNEDLNIVQNIRSMMDLNYLNYEIIIINDGSEDNTLEFLVEAFSLKKIEFPLKKTIETEPVHAIYANPEYPNLLLLDKENGGKADALNAGINASRFPYFASVDADSILDSDALQRIAMSFLEYKYTIAVGGSIRVANGSRLENGKIVEHELPKGILERFQITEYFRAFLVGRVGWDAFNSLMIVSGAFAAFKKDVVIDAGGYTPDTVGEDMELILKLHKYMRKKRYKYRINFLPDPICWTQVPDTFKGLSSQRRRWHVGLIDSLNKNKSILFNPRYGFLGMVVAPYFIVFEMIAPFIEALGLILIPIAYFFGLLSIEWMILFFVATLFFSVILSLGALLVEEYTFDRYVRVRDMLTLSFFSFVETFSYRQLTVIFRLIGLFGYPWYKNHWGRIKRKSWRVQESKLQSTE